MRRALLLLACAACQGDLGIAPSDDLVGEGAGRDLATPRRTDRITQVTKPEVDVLWVIDDSCSMAEEQAKLAENFPEFIKFFLGSGLDWHIGVVSTDTEDPGKNGKLLAQGGYRFLDERTSNPVAVFEQMTALGTSGSPTEAGLLAAQRALQQPSPEIQAANGGFLRDDAALHIIVISDEEDQSAPRVNRNEFVTYLRNLKADPNTPVTFSSIVGPKPLGCRNADTDAVAGAIYIDVTERVGGVFASICEDDWTPVLRELGLQAAGLRREYFLTELPVPGTVEMWVEDGDYVFTGIDQAKLGRGTSLAQACEDADSTACFPFLYSPQRNSVTVLETEESSYIPNPTATVNVRYAVLGAIQPDLEEELDGAGGGAIDTAAE